MSVRAKDLRLGQLVELFRGRVEVITSIQWTTGHDHMSFTTDLKTEVYLPEGAPVIVRRKK